MAAVPLKTSLSLRSDSTIAPPAASDAADTASPTAVASVSAPPALPPGEPGTDAPATITPTNGLDTTQGAPGATQGDASTAHTKSTSAVVDLVNLLVEQGIIKKDKGDILVKKAEEDAAEARAAAAQGSSSNAIAAADSHDVNVDYVPKPVEDKIRSDIRQDVMDQAREENWAAPRQLPQWLQRISFFGDFRFRYEGDYFPEGNIPPEGNPFLNFNAVNTGSPFSQSQNNASPFPTYNVDQDRMRIRVRARLGLNADLGSGFTSGFRIASGSDDSPVTENQSLGAASGQGGNFSKYSVWIDRAFLKKEWGGSPTDLYDASITVGRFDNPFFHTSMIWADDLGFDGVALQGKYQMVDGFTPFFNGGVFPIFNTDLNFGTNNPLGFGNGYSSEDKWLYAAQLGATWKINEDFSFKFAGTFYDFDNIEGQVSSPIIISETVPGGDPQDTASFSSDTDDSRPAFAQHGNTYIPLRDNVPSPGVLINNFQYYGLATDFREAVVTGQLDFNRFDPFHLALIGEMVKNVAFDKNAIINNGPTFGSDTTFGPANNGGKDFYGGDLGWFLRLNAGKVALEKLWDWNVNVGYRYVQTDAVVDGFTDSDFGGYINGTNLKGYTVGGNLAFSPYVWASLRWMSADAVAGPQLKSDTLQVDINAKF